MLSGLSTRNSSKMSNIKVWFTICVVATGQKSTAQVVRALQIDGEEEVYLFPPEKHLLSSHTELAQFTRYQECS